MSSVYFDPALGGDGTTVTDDGNPSTGLANGGHRTRFVPAMANVIGVATFVQTKAAQAAADASTATTKASDASGYASAASGSAASAAAAYDAFDDRYLGAKSSDPTLDNDGNTLLVGAMYWRTTATVGLKVWNGSAWVAAALSSAVAAAISSSAVGKVTATDVQAAIGQLDKRTTYESDHASSVTYSYNASSQLTGVSETVDGLSRSTTLTYNADGSVNTVAVTFDGSTKTRTFAYSAGQCTGSTEV